MNDSLIISIISCCWCCCDHQHKAPFKFLLLYCSQRKPLMYMHFYEIMLFIIIIMSCRWHGYP